MPCSWGLVRDALWRETGRPPSRRLLASLRMPDGALVPFLEPRDLVAWLQVLSAERDPVVARLAEVVREEGPGAEAAIAILFCGLCPELYEVFRREQRWAKRFEKELASILMEAFHGLLLELVVDPTGLTVSLVSRTQTRTHRKMAELRAQGRPPDPTVLVDPCPEPALLVDARYEDAERDAIVQEAIGSLSKADSGPLLAVYRDGMSYAQVATESGEHPDTVRKRIQRSVKMLRDILARALR